MTCIRMKSRVAAATVAALSLVEMAQAGDGRRDAVPLLPAYRQECAACHIAYPPGALPAESWHRLLRGLPNHFGTDASLDPATVQELSGWLAGHAGTWKRAGEPPPEDRITRAAWFVRKHRDVAGDALRVPAAIRPSDCAACHAQAAEGDFHEHRSALRRRP